jgi:hypothetical protein
MELTEAQTRARLIDTRLALAGWNVKDRGQVVEELEILLRDTRIAERPPEPPLPESCFSDYGLLLHGKPAAVVEAKRASWEEGVTARFDAFIAAHTDLTSRQILFLQTLRTFILQTRRVEKRDLVDEPFTRVHPGGIQGLFGDAEIEEILGLARELVRNA